MYELRLLGRADIIDPTGESVPAVLRQPRRLALLAYVVLGEEAIRSRGDLAALCWPELGESAARRNLNQALYFLRKHLKGVLRSEGDHVRADTDTFHADAHQVGTLLAKQDLEAAVNTYRGQLLDGLPDVDSPAFEEWLDRDRSRLHRRISAAAWSLAEAAETNREFPVATFWGERAVQLEGWREAAVRRLMDLFRRVGDLHGALHTYERLREYLRVTFGETPAAETVALGAAVREELDRSGINVEDFAELTRYMDKYVRHCRKGEWEAAAEMLTEDAVYLPPGEPMVEGRQAVLEWLRARPPLIDYQWTILYARRAEGHAWSHGLLAITAEIDGAPLTMTAKVSNTLIRMPDGSWKATSVTWNTDGPGPIV